MNAIDVNFILANYNVDRLPVRWHFPHRG